MIRNSLLRFYSTRVPVDKQCIPLKPTWSIQSLLEPIGEPISDKQFKHLLSLARLDIDKEHASTLKKEIDQLTQLTEHIKKFNTDQKPMTHIWQEGSGQLLRDDEQVECQPKGRDLLKHAKRKSGNFYVVQGSLPSTD
ncbi:hypothetical protein A0J61_01747 [Choanephora cucurbitarum]|uniref:Glutamyl-tRNA(Gln) amidotransferase subunit F, mitochondrial n=1 Tax=Choanephora cucurbitarum TaxID=101091 RepID=A0A1C7NME8_9FUNG|nr:hypothetical protein A0J61_01747 [Choanephora cucurbitarum]